MSNPNDLSQCEFFTFHSLVFLIASGNTKGMDAPQKKISVFQIAATHTDSEVQDL